MPGPRRLLHVRSLGRPAAPPWPGVVRAQRWVTPVQGLENGTINPREPEQLIDLVTTALESGEGSWVVFEAFEPVILFAGVQPLRELFEEACRLTRIHRGLFAAGYDPALVKWPGFAALLERYATGVEAGVTAEEEPLKSPWAPAEGLLFTNRAPHPILQALRTCKSTSGEPLKSRARSSQRL